MFIPLILLLLSLSASLLYLFLFTRTKRNNSSFAAEEYFEEQGLPSTGLERYRLLQENPDGVALEKVKEAARKKVEKTKTPQRERLLLVNGYQFPEERRKLGTKIALHALVASSVTFLLLALLANVTLGLYGAAIATPLSVYIWIYILSRKAAALELQYLHAISGILEPLRKALQSGFNLATTLETLLKQLAFEQDSNPVLLVFQLAIERSKAGYPLHVCLCDTCAETGISQMSQLAGLLGLLEEHGTPWTTAFNELRDSVRAALKVEANRPRKFS